jgi:hypothetical protein
MAFTVDSNASALPPKISRFGRDRYVVVWKSEGATDIKARVFDLSGNPQGEARSISFDDTRDNIRPAVVGYDDGYAVAWIAHRTSGSWQICIEFYNPDGITAWTVSTTPPNTDFAPSLDVLRDRRHLVVTWSAFDGVPFQVFNLNATRNGEIVYAVSADQLNGACMVSQLNDGGFVIVWEQQSRRYVPWFRVFTDRFAPATDAKVANVFQYQRNMAVTWVSEQPGGVFDGGRFVLITRTFSNPADGDLQPQINLDATIFGPDGRKRDDQTGSVTYDSDQLTCDDPSVASTPGSVAVVTWTNEPLTSGISDIRARLVVRGNGSGAPVRINDDVHQDPGWYQFSPCVAYIGGDIQGTLAFAWLESRHEHNGCALKTRVTGLQLT